MRLSAKLSLSFALLLAATACGKDKSPSEGSSSGSASAKTTITLAELNNLKIDVAENTEPSMMGASVMIMSMDESFTVQVAGSSDPETLEAAQKEATETYSATDFKTEKLQDGWALTFKNKGSAGDNYWLNLRRDIGGTSYFCSTSVGFAVLRDGALAACKSLRQ